MHITPLCIYPSTPATTGPTHDHPTVNNLSLRPTRHPLLQHMLEFKFEIQISNLELQTTKHLPTCQHQCLPSLTTITSHTPAKTSPNHHLSLCKMWLNSINRGNHNLTKHSDQITRVPNWKILNSTS
jgi:hypothetical protein